MRTSSLTEYQSRICEALVSAPLPWLTVDQLIASLSQETDIVVDALADLEGTGWLASWEDWPEGVAVTLTPWAAATLEVRIIEDGPRQTPHWSSNWTPDPSPPKAGRVFRDSSALGDVVDPSPSPEELTIAAEERAASPTRSMNSRAGAWPDARRDAQRADEAKKRRRSKARARKRCKP